MSRTIGPVPGKGSNGADMQARQMATDAADAAAKAVDAATLAQSVASRAQSQVAQVAQVAGPAVSAGAQDRALLRAWLERLQAAHDALDGRLAAVELVSQRLAVGVAVVPAITRNTTVTVQVQVFPPLPDTQVTVRVLPTVVDPTARVTVGAPTVASGSRVDVPVSSVAPLAAGVVSLLVVATR